MVPGDLAVMAEDLAELAREAVILLDDHQHGLERIYAIIGARAR